MWLIVCFFGIFHDLVRSIEDNEQFKNSTVTVNLKDAPANATITRHFITPAQTTLQWAYTLQSQLLDKYYANYSLENLRMIVIGSHSFPDYNSRLAFVAEKDFYLGIHIPHEVWQLINCINVALDRSRAGHCDYFCKQAMKHTLFINLCSGKEDDDDDDLQWIETICSIALINRILAEAKQQDIQLAILDLRRSKHIHQEDQQHSLTPTLVTTGTTSDYCYQSDCAFKIDTQNGYHNLLRAGSSMLRSPDDRDSVLNSLEDFFDEGFPIDQLYPYLTVKYKENDAVGLCHLNELCSLSLEGTLCNIWPQDIGAFSRNWGQMIQIFKNNQLLMLSKWVKTLSNDDDDEDEDDDNELFRPSTSAAILPSSNVQIIEPLRQNESFTKQKSFSPNNNLTVEIVEGKSNLQILSPTPSITVSLTQSENEVYQEEHINLNLWKKLKQNFKLFIEERRISGLETRIYTILRLLLILAAKKGRSQVFNVVFKNDSIYEALERDQFDKLDALPPNRLRFSNINGKQIIILFEKNKKKKTIDSNIEAIVFFNKKIIIGKFEKSYSQFFVGDLVEVTYFEDIAIQFDEKERCFWLHQQETIEELYEDFYEQEFYESKLGKRKTSQNYQRCPITGDCNGLEDSKPTERPVKELLEKLVDISRKTRPDICASAGILHNYVHKPTIKLWARAQEILSYLYRTRDQNLQLHPEDSFLVYTDGSGNSTNSNKAVDQENTKLKGNGIAQMIVKPNKRKKNSCAQANVEKSITDEQLKIDKSEMVNKSQTGYFGTLYQCPFIWSSEHQRQINETETVIIELVGTACSAGEMFLLNECFSEFGINSVITEELEMYMDNQIVMNLLAELQCKMIQNGQVPHYPKRCRLPGNIIPVYETVPLHSLDKYLHTLLFLRTKSTLMVRYKRSADNTADLFTKVIRGNFDQIRPLLGLFEHSA